MKIIWEWLKAHWKWLIAPLWALSIFLVWLFTRGGAIKPAVSGTTDQAANNAVTGVIQAADNKDHALAQLETQYQDKLNKMSAAQREEWERQKSKPVGEVAAWIDRF
jgi:hypothetical protein